MDRKALMAKITVLQDEVRRLRSEETSIARRFNAMQKQSSMLSFRNELLTKMVRPRFAHQLDTSCLTQCCSWPLRN